MKKNKNKVITIITLSVLAVVGTYNAIMINSDSLLSNYDAKNFKTLDEVKGVVVPVRTLAVETTWQKLDSKKVIVSEVAQVNSASEVSNVNEAVIKETLSLKLVEVSNTKKWENGVTEFNGALKTNEGMIESLSASLPEGLNVDISFSEMSGNVFEYDLNGEVYSAMMYQVDQNAYMITMTNGPLEGTRMKFAGEAPTSEETENYLAETHNVEIGSFGEETQVQAEVASDVSSQDAQSAAFNFNI